MSGEIKGKTVESQLQPSWLILLRPIDPEKFPDSIIINDLIYSMSPHFDEFEKSLNDMHISESNQHLVYKALFNVWQMESGGIRTSIYEITLGDVRKLNTSKLKEVDGLNEEGSFGISIISKLFSLH